ncbi:heterokaryon incompatibility protein-domain-containing protein [Xylaria castorea]|nr:heterokaryon incompatibility protein-domain-containing protein [Xylaria castorea]
MSKRDDGRNAVVQDTAEPLGQIRDRNATHGSIVSAVLDIQNLQNHAITRNNWIKSLECLYLATDRDSEPTGKRQRLANGDSVTSSYTSELLRRTYLDPVSDSERGREYVAVSYTWDLSEDEEEQESCQSFGGYLIESRKTGEPAQPSNVRDVVFKRALYYAEHMKCETIWIDRECVDQDEANEKETAIQNMHLVYSLSRWPIALLTRTIQTADELDLIVGLLLEDLREEEESAALELLDDITSDLWWKRAWTFQEDYRASTRMTFLIPHTSNLEHRKQTAPRGMYNRPLLGSLPGEICIKSTDFRRCATKFCLQYKQKQPEAEYICNKILTTAGKYNVLLQDGQSSSTHSSISRSMTPTILADIGRRRIYAESERLAIAANCCGYNVRLDTTALNSRSSSLSLSMLALYLLNGEIVENHPRLRHGTLKDSVFTYLAKQSLHSFRPPVDEGLTFIKSCRFVDPVLTPLGTQTLGHLWRLGKVIRPRPLKSNKYRTLSPLETLASDLQYNTYGKSYEELALALATYIRESSTTSRLNKNQRYGGRSPLVRARQCGWRSWMADEVEAALLEGKALRLASVIDPGNPEGYAPYNAIFVGEDADDWEDEEDDDGYAPPTYVFTSIRPPKEHARFEDIPKHVSLEVELEWLQRAREHEHEEAKSTSRPAGEHSTEPGLPKLYIKRWLNGLCFFGGYPRQPVLFPWPADLLATSSKP